MQGKITTDEGGEVFPILFDYLIQERLKPWIAWLKKAAWIELQPIVHFWRRVCLWMYRHAWWKAVSTLLPD